MVDEEKKLICWEMIFFTKKIDSEKKCHNFHGVIILSLRSFLFQTFPYFSSSQLFHFQNIIFFRFVSFALHQKNNAKNKLILNRRRWGLSPRTPRPGRPSPVIPSPELPSQVIPSPVIQMSGNTKSGSTKSGNPLSIFSGLVFLYLVRTG